MKYFILLKLILLGGFYYGIKTTMELIKEKNIFAPGGADLASLVSAKVVETDTTNYDLVF